MLYSADMYFTPQIFGIGGKVRFLPGNLYILYAPRCWVGALSTFLPLYSECKHDQYHLLGLPQERYKDLNIPYKTAWNYDLDTTTTEAPS